MSGPPGLRQQACPARCYGARCLTPPSPWPRLQRRAQGAGVALLPVALFTRELQQGRLVRPFALELHRGAYWLTHLQSRTPTAAMQAFGQWLLEQTH